MIPVFSLIDVGITKIQEELKITSAKITYELNDEGVADECEVNLWFNTLNNVNNFINLYIRLNVNMTVKYGWQGVNTLETAKFQIRGIKTSGNERGGYFLTIKGYSPILEAHDKVPMATFKNGQVPMKVCECILKCCEDNNWYPWDETNRSTIWETNDKPENAYVVEQIGDNFESYAQFMQKLANSVGYDLYMRYNKIDAVPIVYFKPRNIKNEIKYDFQYFYNVVGVDALKMIQDYSVDISVTQQVETLEASTQTTPLQVFDLDNMPDSNRGADSKAIPANEGSENLTSITERKAAAIQPVLEQIYSKDIEDLAECQMTTLGNPLVRQGEVVWISGADMLTNGMWNIIKVVHDFDFSSVSFMTSWTMSKNSIPLADKESMLDNKEDELEEFELDEETQKDEQ